MGRESAERNLGSAAGWRQWARRYTAGLALAMAVVAAAPSGRLSPSWAVVRLHHRRLDGRFDPKELTGAGAVLTVPLSPHATAPDADAPRPTGLN